MFPFTQIHNYCSNNTTFETKLRIRQFADNVCAFLLSQFTTLSVLIWMLLDTLDYPPLFVYYLFVFVSLLIITPILLLVIHLFGINTEDFSNKCQQYYRNRDFDKQGYSLAIDDLRQHQQCCFCHNQDISHSILSEIAITRCGHFFHLDCVSHNGNSVNHCPFCNLPFVNGGTLLLPTHRSSYHYRIRKQITYSTIDKNEHNEDNCCICYETLNGQVNVITSCKHIFHSDCFQKWIKIDQSCPMCRNNK